MLKKNIRLKKSDVIAGAILLIAGVAIYYRVEIGLNYKWNWDKIPQFLTALTMRVASGYPTC